MNILILSAGTRNKIVVLVLYMCYMIVVWMMYRIKYIQGIFLKEIKNVIRGEY